MGWRTGRMMRWRMWAWHRQMEESLEGETYLACSWVGVEAIDWRSGLDSSVHYCWKKGFKMRWDDKLKIQNILLKAGKTLSISWCMFSSSLPSIHAWMSLDECQRSLYCRACTDVAQSLLFTRSASDVPVSGASISESGYTLKTEEATSVQRVGTGRTWPWWVHGGPVISFPLLTLHRISMDASEETKGNSPEVSPSRQPE